MSNRRDLMLSQQAPPPPPPWSLLLPLVATAALLLSSARADTTRVAGCKEAGVPLSESLRLQAISDFADAVRTCYGVPGLAVGFLFGGERHAFGLGVADLESGAPVSEHTVFGVGSLTKAFSSALLAELLPKSGLHWDSPLKDFIPGFRMNTTLLTQYVTLADVLTHRTGIDDFGAPLIAGYPVDVDRRELQKRAQYYTPTHGFRTRASYNNHLYALGGTMVEHVTGLSWEQLINATLFARLNMTRSYFAHLWKDVPNLSKMYHESALGGNTELPFQPLEFVSPVAPAGSILSTANDMLKWLDFVLDKTTASDGFWSQVFTSHVPINGQRYENSFGIGWVKGSYGDIPFWQHQGSIEGYCSIATLLHKHNAAIFLAANKWCGYSADGSDGFFPALQPLARLLAETLLGLPVATDAQSICTWRANASAMAAARAAILPSVEAELAEAVQARAQCVMSGEIRFSNPAFGDVMIACNGSTLRWKYGRSGGSLLLEEVSLPANRSYTLQFEGWREPLTRQQGAVEQARLTFAEDCGSLWLLDQPEVPFVRQSKCIVPHCEMSSGAPSCRLLECSITLLPLFLIVTRSYFVN